MIDFGKYDLIVCDKDKTLIESIADPTDFVQEPSDQQLMEGVGKGLDYLKAIDVPLSIASNQGCADVFSVTVDRLRVDNLVKIDNLFQRIVRIDRYEKRSDIYLDGNPTPFHLNHLVMVEVRYKSLLEVSRELEFAMALTGINNATFAPTMDGMACFHRRRGPEKWDRHRLEMKNGEPIEPQYLYRKPGSGMLRVLREYNCPEVDRFRGLMIGDSDDDRRAAVAGGFDFLEAIVFRSMFL